MEAWPSRRENFWCTIAYTQSGRLSAIREGSQRLGSLFLAVSSRELKKCMGAGLDPPTRRSRRLSCFRARASQISRVASAGQIVVRGPSRSPGAASRTRRAPKGYQRSTKNRNYKIGSTCSRSGSCGMAAGSRCSSQQTQINHLAKQRSRGVRHTTMARRHRVRRRRARGQATICLMVRR